VIGIKQKQTFVKKEKLVLKFTAIEVFPEIIKPRGYIK